MSCLSWFSRCMARCGPLRCASLALFSTALLCTASPLAAQEPIPLFEHGETAPEASPSTRDSDTDKTKQRGRVVDFSWTGAYTPSPDELFEEIARDKGLGKGALRALMKPSTPNAVRIMLLDAAIQQQGASEVAGRVLRALRAWRGEDRALTLDTLRQEELLMLGYLAARASKDVLDPLGGEDEVERVSAMVLLTAAASRRRGDLTTRVVLAQVKAQQGIDHPDEALCAARQCVVDAVRPFVEEWSVEPDFVCDLVAAMPERGPVIRSSEDPLRFCGAPRAERPVFVEQADQEERERKAAIHSSSPQGGGSGVLWGGGGLIQTLPPGAGIPTTGLPPVSLQDQLAMLDMAIAEIERERAKMGAGSMEALLFDEMLREIKLQRDQLHDQLKNASP